MKTIRVLDLAVQAVLWAWAIAIVPDFAAGIFGGELVKEDPGLLWYLVMGSWQLISNFLLIPRVSQPISIVRRIYSWLLLIPPVLAFLPLIGWLLLAFSTPCLAACYTLLCLYEFIFSTKSEAADASRAGKFYL